MDAERIRLLRPGVIVVNSARGALIDDQALQEALRSGQVAAAGLDVFNGEPDIHPGYRELDNTFLLPHIGSATRETRDAVGFRALTIWTRYSPAGSRRIAWHDGLPVLYMAGQPL